MSKMTPARIERQFKIEMAVIWAFRAVVIAFTLVLLVSVLLGQSKQAVYLILPPLWWVLSVLWVLIARDTRETRYQTLEWQRITERAQEFLR